MENRTFRFELKELDQETGVFTGHAAVFGNRDYGGDVIEPGAFRKTLGDKKGKALLLDSHDPSRRLGVVYLEEDGKGLKVTKGLLNLDKQAARDVLADLKFQQEHGVPLEMSIGYDAVKRDFREDSGTTTRVLKEIKLWEVSLVSIAMNPRARVESVKDNADEIASLQARIEKLEALAAEKAEPAAATKEEPASATPPEPAGPDPLEGLLNHQRSAINNWRN